MIALTTLRNHLKDPPAEDNNLIRAYERAAVAHVEKITGRYFGPTIEGASYRVRGTGLVNLYLPQFFSAITSVHASGYEGDAGQAIDGAASDGWVLQTRPGQAVGSILRRKGGGGWYNGYEYIMVGTIGFPATGAGDQVEVAAPDDIRGAVLRLTADLYANREDIVVGSTASVLPRGVRELIYPYRRISI